MSMLGGSMQKSYKELRDERKRKEKEENLKLTKDLILKYVDYYQKNKKAPNLMGFCRSVGRSEDFMRSRFGGGLKAIDAIARKNHPDMFNDKAIKDIPLNTKLIKECKKFIITTAVMGCEKHDGFYKSIKTYCTKNNAQLLILTSADPRASVGWILDKDLANEAVVNKDLKLNSNLFISTIKLSAKQMDPIINLERIGQRKGSFIYASPKQRMKVTPTSNEKMPHVLYTTGAITSPNYDSDHYMSQRTAVIAKEDHILGALVVEIENNEIFHIRHIQADKTGSFIDLGIKYSSNETKKEDGAAIIFGDWHSGETDPKVMDAYDKICKDIKPEYGIVHDLFNGMSINHHEKNNILLKAQRAEQDQLCLKNEMKCVGKDLDIISKWVKKIVVVKSNHDEFLDRYLMEGLYVGDPHNHRFSLELALKILDKKDPLKEAVEIASNKKYNNIKWLKRNDEFKIAGVQLAAHGDCGSNGAKGSIKSAENSYGDCIIAHSHTPQILRGVYCVGTSTHLRLEYNQKGASSWLQSFCLLYKNGSRQIINLIDGKYTI